MPIIIRHNGALNSAAEGFAAGAPGLAQGLRFKQQQEREDARYREEVTRANEQLRMQQEREKRAADEYDRRKQNEQDVAKGYEALDQERIGSITPQQTEAGYVQEGGMKQAMGAGMLAPTAFASGLMQHHDRILKHAKDVASKLPPATTPEAAALHERFWSDVQGGLQRDQDEAYAAKTQSDWTGLLRDMASPNGSSGVEDLLPEVQQRAKDNLELLQQAQAMPPGPERNKAISEAQQASRKALEGQRKDISDTRKRRSKINALVMSYQPQIDRRRAALYGGGDGSGPLVDPDLVPTMEARLDAQQDVLERAKIDPDMTTERFMIEWHSAGTTTVPRSGSGRGGTKPEDPPWKQARDLAVEDAKSGVLGKLPDDPEAVDAIVRKRQQEYERRITGEPDKNEIKAGTLGEIRSQAPEKYMTVIQRLAEMRQQGMGKDAFQKVAEELGVNLDELTPADMQAIQAHQEAMTRKSTSDKAGAQGVIEQSNPNNPRRWGRKPTAAEVDYVGRSGG